jgi:hypothetical protein
MGFGLLFMGVVFSDERLYLLSKTSQAIIWLFARVVSSRIYINMLTPSQNNLFT